MQKRPNSASNITRGVNRPALFSTGHSISIFAEKEKSRHVHTPTHQHLSPVALYGSLFINLQLLHLMDHPEFVKVKPVVRKKYRAAGDCHSSFFLKKKQGRGGTETTTSTRQHNSSLPQLYSGPAIFM